MKQIQVAGATSRAQVGAVQIVKKLIGEVPAFDGDLQEISAWARFVECDVALELIEKPGSNKIDPFEAIVKRDPIFTGEGSRLWLSSIKVVRV